MQEKNNQKKYTFHVHGMHCNACSILIETDLREVEEITDVKASLNNNIVEVTGGFGNLTPEQIAESLNKELKADGYTLSLEKKICISYDLTTVIDK